MLADEDDNVFCDDDDNLVYLPMLYPSLLAGMQGAEAYAFHSWPSFAGETWIRVSKDGERIQLDGHVGGATMCDKTKVSREVTQAEWDALVQSVERAGLWAGREYPQRRGLDGHTYKFEGRREVTRCRLSLWCPSAPEIIGLAKAFMDLAGATALPGRSG